MGVGVVVGGVEVVEVVGVVVVVVGMVVVGVDVVGVVVVEVVRVVVTVVEVVDVDDVDVTHGSGQGTGQGSENHNLLSRLKCHSSQQYTICELAHLRGTHHKVCSLQDNLTMNNL